MSAAGLVQFVDLAAQHAEIAGEVERGFAAVMADSAYIQGRPVTEFEDAFAAFSEVAHCIGVANGTDGLEIALRAAGVGRGDEVILPANTFVATAEAVTRAGATVVLVDCDPATYLIDVEQAVARIGPRTRAVIPVHLYGQCATVEALLPAAEGTGAVVLEDAAQSQGARRHGKRSGSLGHAAATSFYPGKNLGAYGDAGAVLTPSAELAAAIRAIGNHGSSSKYHHPRFGFNSRMDTLQAVVLRAKLARLDCWNTARRDAASRYAELLGDIDALVLPVEAAGNEHVWHLFVVRVPRRDEVLRRLQEAGVGAAVHYPVPVHLHGAFAGVAPPGSLPIAERQAGEILSLPMHPHLTVAQQERVAAVLRSAL